MKVLLEGSLVNLLRKATVMTQPLPDYPQLFGILIARKGSRIAIRGAPRDSSLCISKDRGALRLGPSWWWKNSELNKCAPQPHAISNGVLAWECWRGRCMIICTQ